MAIKSNFPHRKSVSVTEEMQARISAVVESRSMTEPYVLRDLIEGGLSAWESSQEGDKT